MKKFVGFALVLALGLTFALGTAIANKAVAKDDAPEVTCPVSGRAVNPEATVDYKGAKVAFCCTNCPKAFAKDPAKYAAKANHQLYVTGHAKLAKCPISGRKLDPATKISVAGTDICFCCNGCKGKVTKLAGDEQLESVFGDAAFEKGFEIVKK